MWLIPGLDMECNIEVTVVIVATMWPASAQTMNLYLPANKTLDYRCQDLSKIDSGITYKYSVIAQPSGRPGTDLTKSEINLLLIQVTKGDNIHEAATHIS